MSTRVLSTFFLTALFIIVGTLSLPLFVHAVGTAANPACVPTWDYSCPCGQVCKQNGPPGGLGCHCQDSTNGGSVPGHCDAPLHCHGDSFSGAGQSGGAGMEQLLKALGDLASKLMQGGGGGGGGGSQPQTPPTSGCLSGYYQTSDVSKISDPCAQYTPSVSSGINTTGGTGTCDALSQSLGLCGNSSGNQTGDALTVNPTSGPPPLNVTATFSSGTSCSDAFDLSWGDSSTDQTQQYAPPAGGACTAVAQNNSFTHTYTNVGTYTVTLTSGSNLQFTSTVTVKVGIDTGTSGGATSTQQTSYPVLNASSTSYGGIYNGQVPPGGYSGNIFFNGGGATVVSGSRDIQGGSEVAGFYGGDTFGAPQGLAARWCQSRPWATNFLSHIVPPTFLDGVCQTFGFQVGTPTPTLTQTKTQSNSHPGQTSQPATQTTPPATTTSAVNASASIWAVPASVPLGARTSIFWNSRGVQTCTETSPDGSFSQSTLSGGAATVPLTGPTTFTISCLTGDGTPVTNYTIVNIKS